MSKPNFNQYIEITAKFDSTGSCGHSIKKGDRIGYTRRNTQCNICWTKWCDENREANDIENGYKPNAW